MSIVASRGSPQFLIRLPGEMHAALKEAAGRNGRTLNSEMVARMSEHLGGSTEMDERKTNRLYPDRQKTSIRMPPGMRERLKARAKENNRSMNAEITSALFPDRVTPSRSFAPRPRFDIEVPDPWA